MATKSIGLVWHGDRIISEMRRAEVRGIGFVRAAAARHARRNHPGWKKISGRAERSVKPQGKVHREGNAFVGEWGSRLFYVLFLELHNGSFLRNAADATYPKLADQIRRFYEQP